MKKDFKNYDDKELILYLVLKVHGIGEVTAKGIPAYIKNFQDIFLSNHMLENFKNNKGKSVLTAKQISDFDKIVKEYFPKKITDIHKAWVSVLIRDFVKNSIREIESTDLENLLINPFLIKAFGFNNHVEVITFYLYQKVTRSIVTSWGFALEGLILSIDGEKSNLEGFDILIHRNSKEYHFQIKSSPNTMSIEQVRQLNVHIQKIKNTTKQIPMLGMTYGTREQVNSQIQSTLLNYPESTMIGKEFWDFIADEEGYCLSLLDWIGEIMKLEPANFSSALESKKKSIIKEWEKTYGKGVESIDRILEKYL